MDEEIPCVVRPGGIVGWVDQDQGIRRAVLGHPPAGELGRDEAGCYEGWPADWKGGGITAGELHVAMR